MKIVMYHYVRPLQKSMLKGLKGLDTDKFYKQLQYFIKEYNVIDHDNLYDYLYAGQSLPDKALLLTFDDGYLDIYRYVLPALQALNLKASFYVPDYFQDRKLLDVNAIHYLLTKEENVDKYLNFIKEYIKVSDLTKTFEEYINSVDLSSRFDRIEIVAFKKLLQFILPEEHRKSIINELLNRYCDYDMETLFEDFYCSKQQLNTIINAGMHVGGHGVRHYWLNQLSDKEQADEIKGSMDFLKTLNLQKYYSFCYPYGGYNEKSKQLLEENNFKFSFTTKIEDYDLDRNKRFEIPRFDTNDFYPMVEL